MPIAVADHLQVKWFCRQAEQIAINIRHYRVETLVGAPTDQEYADAFSATVGPSYKSVLSTNASYFGMTLYQFTVGGWVPLANSRSGSGPGTAGVEALPRQAAGLITLRAAGAGRSQRGRAYVPFCPETFNDTGGVPTAAAIAAFDNLAFCFQGTLTIVGIVGGGFTSDVNGEIYHRGAGGFDLINTFVSQPKWATQKRRGSYGKANSDPF